MAIPFQNFMSHDEAAALNGAAGRLVCDQRGRVLYANDAFQTLAHLPFPIEAGMTLFDLFRFERQCKDLDDLQDGEYAVRFAMDQRIVPLFFDWANMADGRRFLIVSQSQTIARDALDFDVSLPKDLTTKISVNYDDINDIGFDHFMDMSHEVLCLLNVDLSLGWMNEAFCKSLKTDTTILQQKHFIDLLHPKDIDQFQDAIRILYNTDSSAHNFQCRMFAGDGDVLFFDWRIKKIDEKIYVVGQDITAIKRQETALQSQKNKLEEAEAISHMGHWHWIIGESHFIWSDEIYKIMGQDKNTFFPSMKSVGSLLYKEDAGRILQSFQRAMIENKDYEMDFCIKCKDGSIRYIRCLGRCETDFQGDVVGLYGIMQDITQDTIREKDLRDAKESAERAYAAKSRFLANMSHELRTPLNAIIGFSEVIQNQLLGPLGNERYKDYIDGIHQSGRHLLDLISDILDMSKIEAGKYTLELEKFNFSKLIRVAVHMVEGRSLSNDVRITIDLESEDRQIVADRRAVMQIILNIVSNAVKFSHDGSHVQIQTYMLENKICLEIEDNGIGIPADKLQTVMSPFEQVSSEYIREYEGSGLGLSITKELVDMHGGSITIESEEDMGTKVLVVLPLCVNATDTLIKSA